MIIRSFREEEFSVSNLDLIGFLLKKKDFIQQKVSLIFLTYTKTISLYPTIRISSFKLNNHIGWKCKAPLFTKTCR